MADIQGTRITQKEIKKRVAAAQEYVRARDILDGELGMDAFIVAETTLEIQKIVRNQIKKRAGEIAELVAKEVGKKVTPEEIAEIAQNLVGDIVRDKLKLKMEDVWW